MHRVFTVLVVWPYRRLIIESPAFYPLKFDNFASRCNFGFLSEKEFLLYYAKSIEFGGRDYKFYLRVHQDLWCAGVASSIEGDYVELGTGKGFIFAAVCEYMKKTRINKCVFLFDTFLPYKTDMNTGAQIKGRRKSKFYANDYDEVAGRFNEFDFVTHVQGKCPDSLLNLYDKSSNRKIAFLHVDLNYHQVEIDSLTLLWPKLTSGAVILLDDYANPGRDLQYEAFTKFFTDLNTSILTTGSGQGIIIKS